MNACRLCYLAFLTATACSAAPEIHYYTLSAESATERVPVSAGPGAYVIDAIAIPDLLDRPQIVLRSVRLESAGPPAAGTGSDAGGETRAVLARVQTTVRGQVRTISVPALYQLAAGTVTVSGEIPLRQSDLGLTPFSALLGALQVQDEMHVRFRLVARAADSRSGAPH